MKITITANIGDEELTVSYDVPDITHPPFKPSADENINVIRQTAFIHDIANMFALRFALGIGALLLEKA